MEKDAVDSFLLSILRYKRKEAIIKLVKTVGLGIILLILIFLYNDYYNLMEELNEADTTQFMLMTLFPYILVGFVVLLQFVVELFDIKYVWRSYITTYKLYHK